MIDISRRTTENVLHASVLRSEQIRAGKAIGPLQGKPLCPWGTEGLERDRLSWLGKVSQLEDAHWTPESPTRALVLVSTQSNRGFGYLEGRNRDLQERSPNPPPCSRINACFFPLVSLPLRRRRSGNPEHRQRDP